LKEKPANSGNFRPAEDRACSRVCAFNKHLYEGDGETIFAHACKLGLEGIVSKRKDSTYRSGRSPDWLKMKNPAAPAVKREAEEEWGR
jgi:ATP-dependent DNA ligase